MRAIAAASCGFGALDIFFPTPDLGIGHKAWQGSYWQATTDRLGGAFATVPAAVASRAKRPPHRPPKPPPHPTPGPAKAKAAARTEIGSDLLDCRVDVFAVDTDLAMRQLTLWDGVVPAPAQWANLGGVFISAPAAINWLGQRIDLFGLGLDHALYRKVWDGARWSADWERLGGTFNSPASVISKATDRIDLFVRGADYSLRHRAFGATGPRNAWQNLGGVLASAPAAIAWGGDRMDVFAVGPDAALQHRWWDGEIWNDWESLGGTLSSDPSVVSWGPGTLDVFAVGADRALYHFAFANETWSGPAKLGDAADSAPTAFALAPGSFNLLVPGTDRWIHHAEFDGLAWSTLTDAVAGGEIGLPTRYRFGVDYVQCDTARSLNSDTDTAQATLAPGKWPVRTEVQHNDAIGGTAPKQWQTNLLEFLPIPVELCETASLNYVIVNNGHADQLSLDTALIGIGGAIADKAVTALTGVDLLGTAADKLVGYLGAYLFQDCDGPVAAANLPFDGLELYRKTGAHALDSVTDTQPGVDSPVGCGANSLYEVTWSVKRV